MVTTRWVQAVINYSLQEGMFPGPLKEALVHPLLKKTSLNPIGLDNFHPISQVVAWQLQRVLHEMDYLDDPFQSDFSLCYGTETALVALLNDL